MTSASLTCLAASYTILITGLMMDGAHVHMLFDYGEVAGDIVADFCLHNLSYPFVKGFLY